MQHLLPRENDQYFLRHYAVIREALLDVFINLPKIKVRVAKAVFQH